MTSQVPMKKVNRSQRVRGGFGEDQGRQRGRRLCQRSLDLKLVVEGESDLVEGEDDVGQL